MRKADNSNFIFVDDKTIEVIRLVNIVFVYVLQDARFFTSRGTEKKLRNFLGQTSTKLRLLIRRGATLSTFLEVFVENEVAINNSSLEEKFIKNHKAVNRGLIKEYLPLYEFLDFVNHLKKGLGFELEVGKTNRKEDFLYTLLADANINVTIFSISIYIPNIIPCPEIKNCLMKLLQKISHYHSNHG